MGQGEFVATILDILSPICNVFTVKSQGFLGIYIDKVMFAKIISKSILFLSDGNKFIKLESKLIARLLGYKNQYDQSDLDTFLCETSKA